MNSNRQFSMFGRLVSTLGAAALALSVSLPSQAQEPIEIGEITSLTGTNAVQGLDIKRGIQLAVDRINGGYEVPMKDGGSKTLGPGLLDGRQIKMIIEDTESRPASAMAASRSVVSRARPMSASLATRCCTQRRRPDSPRSRRRCSHTSVL